MERVSCWQRLCCFKRQNIIIYMKELISVALSLTLFAKNLSSVVSKTSGNFC